MRFRQNSRMLSSTTSAQRLARLPYETAALLPVSAIPNLHSQHYAPNISFAWFIGREIVLTRFRVPQQSSDTFRIAQKFIGAMRKLDTESDAIMMRRCIALAKSAGQSGEYPFAAVIARRGEFICESINMVRAEGDLTRHAEMVTIASAQKKLRATSLDDCTLYSTVEPCAMCSYAIRETRIGRVVFSLRSPVMGGHSRWKVLTDSNLSSALPEVFARPPIVRSGYLQHDVQAIFQKRSPLTWRFMKARKIFVESPDVEHTMLNDNSRVGRRSRLANLVRAVVLDRLWRS
jgi:tRNA(adenine34) deaminase